MTDGSSEKQTARELVASASRIVGFTGAGISTESRVPDFRSPEGVWAHNRTVYFQEFLSSEADRIEYWRQKMEGWPAMRDARPNAGTPRVRRAARAGQAAGDDHAEYRTPAPTVRFADRPRPGAARHHDRGGLSDLRRQYTVRRGVPAGGGRRARPALQGMRRVAQAGDRVFRPGNATRRQQRARLASLGLYKRESDGDHICPLCEAHLEDADAQRDRSFPFAPGDREQIGGGGAEKPHLQERLSAFAKKRLEIEKAIVATQRELERAYAENEKARQQRDEVIERARVVGRIGAFLDQFSLLDEKEDLDRLIDAAERRVEVLAERVSAEDVEERVYTFLNLIADHMTDYAATLQLEHAEGRIRLDLKRLSVVAETVMGPIPLNRIGSGENWVGYHVVALLALHRWFREQNRPVPAFLVFDQPSQAHYPPEADQSGRTDSLRDADRLAVHNLFSFMHLASQAIGNGFQLIVLDHAHLDDDWFNAAIVEEWRGDAALVPVE